MKVKGAQLCLTLWPHGAYSPWNSSGQNTGVGSHSLLQGIFLTQGLNPGLQVDFLPAEPPGKPHRNKMLSLFPLLPSTSLVASFSLTWCLSTRILHDSVFIPTLGYFSDPHGFNNHPYSDAFQRHGSPLISPKTRICNCLLSTSTYMLHGHLKPNVYKSSLSFYLILVVLC